MGKPAAMTVHELLLEMAAPSAECQRDWASIRRAIVEHRLDYVLLRNLVKELLNGKRKPQRISELERCNLAERIDETWRWVVTEDGRDPHHIDDDARSALSWSLHVLTLPFLRPGDDGINEIQVVLTRKGLWFVLLKLSDRTLLKAFDSEDTEGLKAWILELIPESAYATTPRTGLNGYDEVLLQIYEDLVRQEAYADELRESRLRTARHMTGCHRRTLRFFCPPVAP